MISSWPEYKEDLCFAKEESVLGRVKDLVRAVRNLRNEMDVPPQKKAHLFVVAEEETVREEFEQAKESSLRLASASDITIQKDRSGIDEKAVSVVLPQAVCYIPMEELVDLEKEKERLLKEKERLEKELARSNGMLKNEKFLSKAPADKIEAEKEKLKKYEEMQQER